MRRLRDRLYPTSQRVAAAGICVGGLFLALQIVAVTLSDSSRDPETALSWRPFSSVALAWAVDDILASAESEEDYRLAARGASRALRVSPLEVGAVRSLAFVADRQSDETRARALMEIAVAKAPRDPRAQAWMFRDELRGGNYPGALSHLDAVLRVRPRLFDDLLPVLTSFAEDPAAFEALAVYLQSKPPWRRLFLLRLPSEVENPGRLTPLYASLKAGPTPPEPQEFSAYLRSLLGAGQVDLAYLLWLQSLPEERRAGLTALYNGRFEYPVSGLPFDWILGDVKGAESGVVPLEGGDANALRVRFYNTRVPFRHVSHLLALPPGDYRLVGQVRTDGLRTPRGLQWRVSCGGQELGASTLFAEPVPWTRFQFDVRVPADPACKSQMLQLQIAARVASEQQIEGEVWFMNLEVVNAEPQVGG